LLSTPFPKGQNVVLPSAFDVVLQWQFDTSYLRNLLKILLLSNRHVAFYDVSLIDNHHLWTIFKEPSSQEFQKRDNLGDAAPVISIARRGGSFEEIVEQDVLLREVRPTRFSYLWREGYGRQGDLDTLHRMGELSLHKLYEIEFEYKRQVDLNAALAPTGSARGLSRPAVTGGKRYAKCFTYAPAELAQDSQFPLRPGDTVEIHIDPRRKRVVVQPS
jgi:hypothetical protein